MERFQVKFKKSKTGEWYIVTSADSIENAYAAAEGKSLGRPYKIIDTARGTVLKKKKPKK